jgi:hypothetical protein
VVVDAWKEWKRDAANENHDLFGRKKAPALQAMQLAVQSKGRRERKSNRRRYVAKPGKNSRGLPESQELNVFLMFQFIVYSAPHENIPPIFSQ